MAPTEAERHDLREELRDVLREGAVTTLMDSLPPMDWRELATKTDLAALEERLDTRFERVDAKFDALRVEMDAKFTEMDAKFTGMDAKFTGMDAKFTEMDAKIDTGLAEMDVRFKGVDAKFTEMRGEMKLGLAKQTYVVLAGVATMLAAALTPIYLALFAAPAG